MHKILITIGATALLILFGMQNSDHVPVSLIVGGPTKIRLIFLLLIAAACGFLACYVRGLGREIRLKREIRRLLGMRRSATGRASGVRIRDRGDE